MRQFHVCLLVIASVGLLSGLGYTQTPLEPSQRRVENEPPKVQAVVRSIVPVLIQMQKKDGGWSDGVWGNNETIKNGSYGYSREITSLVAEALLIAAPDDKKAQAAVQRGLAFVLKSLDESPGGPATQFVTWRHAFALEFLCQVRVRQKGGAQQKRVEEWIPRLVEMLIKEQFPGGGWGHSRREGDGPHSFATGPVTLTLLLARSQGEKIPDAVFERTRQSLEATRLPNGAFVYDGTAKTAKTNNNSILLRGVNSLPESIARSAVCESALVLLGGGSTKAVQRAVENFFYNWEELDKRRGEHLHGGPYNIGSHYIYYAYRYVAQAIQLLPEKERTQKQDRLLKLLLQTRDDDGTWNDDTSNPHPSYSTAMIVLALLGDRIMPPKWTKKP